MMETSRTNLDSNWFISFYLIGLVSSINTQSFLLGDHRELEPPDPLPNSEVKRLIADGSVGLPHVRVGHRQALI